VAEARYHAFTDASIFPYRPPAPPATGLRRLWQRLVYKLWRSMQEQQLQSVFRAFEHGAVFEPGLRLTLRAWCHNPGPRENIRLGRDVICRGILRSESFQPGQIVIGDNVYLGDDTLIASAAQVSIGAFTMLAHGVQVFDNNSHPLDATERERDQQIAVGNIQGQRPAIASAPIWIGENSWIGFNAIVLKGVRIGPRSIVAAGSVVTKDVPPNSVAAGNPARVIKEMSDVE
jgi:acetyltransferase-like isoleucine patch superfamily enzyme